MVFIQVAYGEQQTKPFNPACKSRPFLSEVQRQTGYIEHELVDLVNTAAKQPLRLYNTPDDSVAEHVKERELYVLCKVVVGGTEVPEGSVKFEQDVYTPLYSGPKWDPKELSVPVKQTKSSTRK